MGKARAAVRMARETKALEAAVNGGRAALLAASGSLSGAGSEGGICLMGGGIPIKDGSGKIVGGVGVSGDTPANDHTVASAGLAEVIGNASISGEQPKQPKTKL